MFLATAHDGVPRSTGWDDAIYGEDCCVCVKSGGLFVAIPVAIRHDIEQIEGFLLLNGSGFNEVLGYDALESAKENDWCADDAIGWFSYIRDTASVRAVPVLPQESNKRDTSRA